MGRPKTVIPKLCVDRNGRAFTKVQGRIATLGRADSPESKSPYAELLPGIAQGKTVTSAMAAGRSMARATVSEVCLRYITDYAIPRYKNPNGTPSAEVDCFKSIIRIMRELLGESPADEFQVHRFRVVRQAMLNG